MTDNAATQLLAACKEVFDAAWKNEKARYFKAFELYQEAKKKHKLEEEKYGNYSPRCVSTEDFLLRALTGDEKAKSAFLKASASRSFKELCHVMYMADPNSQFVGGGKGIEVYVAHLEKDYLEGVTLKLRLALEKKEIHTCKQASCVTVSSGAKGFEVRAVVDGKSFATDCIGAGGYNIQCFHYRYLIKY